MSNFKSYINYDEFEEFEDIAQTKYSKIVTSQKFFLPTRKYIFKIFQYECYSSKDQKLILDTFFQISKRRSPYIQSYKHISFIYEQKFTPTFSMRHISTKTLANILADPKELQEFSLEELIQCFFAVSQ